MSSPAVFGGGFAEPPRPILSLDIQGQAIPLAYVCHACSGQKREGAACMACDGLGKVPTPQGMSLLAFVIEFAPWMEARRKAAKEREEARKGKVENG